MSFAFRSRPKLVDIIAELHKGSTRVAGSPHVAADMTDDQARLYAERFVTTWGDADDVALVEASKNKALVVRGTEELDGKKDGIQKGNTISSELSKLMVALVDRLDATDVRERLAATRTFVESVLVRLGNVPEADRDGFLAEMRNEMPCLHDSVLAPFAAADSPLAILLGKGEHRDEHANEGVGGATAQLVGCVRTGVEAMGARLVLVDMSPFYTAEEHVSAGIGGGPLVPCVAAARLVRRHSGARVAARERASPSGHKNGRQLPAARGVARHLGCARPSWHGARPRWHKVHGRAPLDGVQPSRRGVVREGTRPSDASRAGQWDDEVAAQPRPSLS